MDTLANYCTGGCELKSTIEGLPQNPIIGVATSSRRIDCVFGKFDPVLQVVRYLFKEANDSIRGGGIAAEWKLDAE